MIRALLERLGRITTTGSLIPQIDGLRFVAIGTVVLYHLGAVVGSTSPVAFGTRPDQTVLGRFAAQGHYGVELFFGISGFILALPFAKYWLRGARKPQLGAYFLRRLTRLEPPYVLAMLMVYVLQVANGRDIIEHGRHLLASLVYQHNLIYGQASTLNPVAWSLEVEVQFYVVAPLLALVFAIRPAGLRRAVMLGAWLLAIGLKPLWAHEAGPLRGVGPMLPHYFEYFWGGFILAERYLTGGWDVAEVDGRWDLVSLLGWPLLVVVWLEDRITAQAFPVLVPLLYAAALRGRISSRLFANRWLVVIGGMCYTIYLFHQQIIAGLARFTQRASLTDRYDVNVALQGVILLPVVLLMCGVFFAAVERPCMRPDWPQRLVGTARTWLSSLGKHASRGGDA